MIVVGSTLLNLAKGINATAPTAHAVSDSLRFVSIFVKTIDAPHVV